MISGVFGHLGQAALQDWASTGSKSWGRGCVCGCYLEREYDCGIAVVDPCSTAMAAGVTQAQQRQKYVGSMAALFCLMDIAEEVMHLVRGGGGTMPHCPRPICLWRL